MIEAALRYASRGLSVLPLHSVNGEGCSCGDSECRTPAKHPRTPHGLKDATTDEETIRLWFRTYPAANLGLATGAVSGLWVLDVDGDVGEKTLAKLQEEYEPLPRTIQQATGRGRHLFFRYPGRQIANRAGSIGPGLDVRGDGGYVVVAPSTHVSGATYEWVT